MTVVLACAWGVLVGWPCAARARRMTSASRARGLPGAASSPRSWSRTARIWIPTRPGLASVVRVAGGYRRRRDHSRRDDALAREVAIAVDLVGVGVNAGCPPYEAVELAAVWSPPLVAPELGAVVHACALGQSFDESLRAAGRRTPAVRALTDTLRTSARLGSPAAPALVRLAAEVRADVRRRAEARARTVPVRLCFPLVFCVLPAFGLLTVVPVVVDGLHH